MELQHEESPAFYRRRYEQLLAKAREVNANRVAAEPAARIATLAKNVIVTDETIPGGWYWTTHVPRGKTLRIINTSATPGVSAMFWNAGDTSERYNPADTVKLQWSAKIGRGKILLSDMGRVMASITDDTCEAHDTLLGGSTRESNARNFGADAPFRNTRDNFVLAASKHGLSPRDVGPCITFFAPVGTDESGKFAWRDGLLSPGQYVDLRAELPLIAALSNCPHPLFAGAGGSTPIRAVVWNSPPPAGNDYCRTISEEASRAFENTDASAMP